MFKFQSLPLLAGVAALGLLPLFANTGAEATPVASPMEFMTATSNCSETCGATATFTPGAGTLTIVLTNTEANIRSAGDALSDIEFLPSGTLGTAASVSSQTGSLIDVTSGNPGSPVSGDPTRWGASITGGQVVLTALTGTQPENMIIGPADSMGNYSNANSSIKNFNPYIDGTGTFVISDPNITSATTISAVTFSFGTKPDTFIAGVPVPAPLIGQGLPVLLAVAGLLFGGKLLERSKKHRLLGAAVPHAAA